MKDLKYYLPTEEKADSARSLICEITNKPYELNDFIELADFAAQAYEFEMTEYMPEEFGFPSKIIVLHGDDEYIFDIEVDYEPSYWATEAN